MIKSPVGQSIQYKNLLEDSEKVSCYLVVEQQSGQKIDGVRTKGDEKLAAKFRRRSVAWLQSKEFVDFESNLHGAHWSDFIFKQNNISSFSI